MWNAELFARVGVLVSDTEKRPGVAGDDGSAFPPRRRASVVTATPQKRTQAEPAQFLWGAGSPGGEALKSSFAAFLFLVRAAGQGGSRGRLDAREARTKIESMLFAFATTHY